MSDKPLGLTEKLSAIYSEVNEVPKNGYNSYNNYSYFLEDDLSEMVRPKFAEHGIFVYPSCMEQDVTVLDDGKILTTVTMKYHIVDSESGEERLVLSQGQGMDTQDKGVYKAITGAQKYFLYKLMMIAADDEPESDNPRTAPQEQNKPEPQPPSDAQTEYLIDLLGDNEGYWSRLISKFELNSELAGKDVDTKMDELQNALTKNQVSDLIDSLT